MRRRRGEFLLDVWWTDLVRKVGGILRCSVELKSPLRSGGLRWIRSKKLVLHCGTHLTTGIYWLPLLDYP